MPSLAFLETVVTTQSFLHFSSFVIGTPLVIPASPSVIPAQAGMTEGVQE